METKAFWVAFKEVLIILLGLSVINACSIVATQGLPDLLTVFNFCVVLLIMYRFGFGNIVLVDTEYTPDQMPARTNGFYHLSGFIAMGLSSLIMVSMSYQINFAQYSGRIYILFAAIAFVDCIWEWTQWHGLAEFRKNWHWNKLWPFPFFILIYVFLGDEVPLLNRASGLAIDRTRNFYTFIFILTIINSAVTVWIGRRLFFPFFFTDRLEARPVNDRLEARPVAGGGHVRGGD
jgi:hypothetical protein